MDRDFIVNNLVAGVYTHHDKYFKKFTDNWNENYQNVELIYNIDAGKINENMEKLRHKFIATGKRYWLFCDEDIMFPNNQVIEKAMETMRINDLDLCTTYATSDHELSKNVNLSNLTFEFITWSAGYFMLVDSKKVGLTPFDLSIPTSHGNLADLGYCLDIIQNHNALIGIAPVIIYHDDAGYSPKVKSPYQITEEKLPKINKVVESFFKNYMHKELYYGNRKVEVVFFDDGSVDINETIGGHYLKCKHPNIYKEIVARHHYDTINTNKSDNFTFDKKQ